MQLQELESFVEENWNTLRNLKFAYTAYSTCPKSSEKRRSKRL
ncbi:MULTISPECIES: hypothetical protein [unclassified Archaeoglobus]|nr:MULTISPECIES: hypothetical protein [unclassified Archaeoglobus]